MSEGTGGDETPVSSPKNKVKFMCSFGGKIMPRPADGHLRYVGGETRVVAVPRDISYRELLQKVGGLLEGELVLKYQIIPEDLDALITVRSDEELHHMMDEYDRQESKGSPKLRAFLFPSKPIVLDHSSPLDLTSFEHYVDAINGVVRVSHGRRHPPINTAHYLPATASSACSSPKSLSPNSPMPNVNDGQPAGGMHRVRSTPTLCTFNTGADIRQTNPGISLRRPTALPTGGGDSRRSHPDQSLSHHYAATRHFHHGRGGDYGGEYGRTRLDRTGSVPQSPRRVVWE